MANTCGGATGESGRGMSMKLMRRTELMTGKPDVTELKHEDPKTQKEHIITMKGVILKRNLKN